MIDSTEGIVLHSIPYSETSIIAHIYSKKFGNISCIMGNVRGSRSKSAYFRPLSIIKFQIYNKKNNTLQRIKDIEYVYMPQSMYDSIYKANIALFLGEFLHKLCIHFDANIELFNFVESYIQFLDTENETYHQSHILFLIHLLRFWGIFPQKNFKEGWYFNKQHGLFEETYTEACVSKELSPILYSCIQSNNFSDTIVSNRKERQELLEAIISYYQIHVHSIQTLHTLEILKTIFT